MSAGIAGGVLREAGGRFEHLFGSGLSAILDGLDHGIGAVFERRFGRRADGRSLRSLRSHGTIRSSVADLPSRVRDAWRRRRNRVRVRRCKSGADGRSADRRFEHFLPMGDPAWQAAEREHDGEHLHRNLHRPVNDAAVEVDVRVEFAIDEIRIFERGFFEPFGDVEQRIDSLEFRQQPIRLQFDDRRPRIEILVDAMAETHQAQAGRLILHLANVFGDVAAVLVNGRKHIDDRLVGAAVERSPQCAHAGGDGSEEVGLRAADEPNRRGAAVLFVVGMQQQHQVESLHLFRIGLVWLGRRTEHHVQQVLDVAAVSVWDKRTACLPFCGR